jgi:hypothetical protein
MIFFRTLEQGEWQAPRRSVAPLHQATLDVPHRGAVPPRPVFDVVPAAGVPPEPTRKRGWHDGSRYSPQLAATAGAGAQVLAPWAAA